MNGAAFLEPVALSLKVSLIASAVVFVAAAWVAWRMSLAKFRGRTIVETFIMLPLVLPPTVVGFVLLVVFGRQSPVGRLFENVFGQSIVFSWGAAVIAAVVVAFPLVYQTLKVGFQSADADLQDAARSMGASERQVLRFITLPLAWRSLVSGYVLGFARGLGEFGATLMLAGNIPGRTQTVPTAIYFAVDAGNLGLAWLWCFAMIAISFAMLYAAGRPGFSRR
ncbi:molybdate ABC transporter permease subunit [Paenibacillus validus]|uniref:Molybdenum transport system permease n=2 Tax=Paenibacillus TaxID=44249 RepID=A0A7X2ZAT5_9BACL|nr:MULTISPECIES: molybdate ABC transporter permease subunit [Paenibacillus]MED4604143.1 molybdate ABC transporter permease subunit [Paenibacillus validus]MED4609655.1 molybdate ABC transporter permease subunit [Paenibacillus validus]MUG71504.1 molybdate ABC transporter permease subunit [Paenibacillus validus]